MKTIVIFEASEMSSLMRADIFCSTSEILSNKTKVCAFQKIHVCTFEVGQEKSCFICTESIPRL